MKYLDAAYEILKQTGHSLHQREIIKLATEQKLIQTSNPRSYDSLGAQIGTEIKKKKNRSRFVKDEAKRGTYGLRVYPVTTSRTQPLQNTPAGPQARGGSRLALGSETQPLQNTPAGGRSGKRKGPDFVGPGGELLVQSELLFRRYEVSKPVPDIGVDIVARKDDKTFYIQVKTRNMAEGPYSYDIKKQSFERTPKQGTYYVFVMRNPSAGSADFIVLPHAEMAAMIKRGDIRQTKRQPASYQVIFTQKSGAVECKGRSMIKFKNNWAIA